MNILEIVVIGSKESAKEKLYTLLSDTPIRNFQGFDFGSLHLADDLVIYFYFINQEQETYRYLWDLIIPHAYCCLILIEWENEELFAETIKLIEQIEQYFCTPLSICAFKPGNSVNTLLIDHMYNFNGTRKFAFFDTSSKESAKNILINLLEADK
jgi:signal recognition particle receptor subunit beta